MTKTELVDALKAAGIDLTANQIKKAKVDDLQVRLDATKVKKPARAPRGLDDRVLVEPGSAEDVKPTKEGSKRALLVTALSRGTTVEHLMDILGWNRPNVTSAIYSDVNAIGLGVERREGKYRWRDHHDPEPARWPRLKRPARRLNHDGFRMA